LNANQHSLGDLSNPAADLVIRNAKVVTIDKDNPRAQAIAFEGQTIIAVTSNKGIILILNEFSAQTIMFLLDSSR